MDHTQTQRQRRQQQTNELPNDHPLFGGELSRSLGRRKLMHGVESVSVAKGTLVTNRSRLAPARNAKNNMNKNSNNSNNNRSASTGTNDVRSRQTEGGTPTNKFFSIRGVIGNDTSISIEEEDAHQISTISRGLLCGYLDPGNVVLCRGESDESSSDVSEGDGNGMAWSGLIDAERVVCLDRFGRHPRGHPKEDTQSPMPTVSKEQLKGDEERIQKMYKSRERVSVSFAGVQVHKHAMVLGDNPAVTSGLPITLDWDVVESEEYEHIDEFETGFRERGLNVMSSQERADILRANGHSRDDLIRVGQEIKSIQHSRKQAAKEAEKDVDNTPASAKDRRRRPAGSSPRVQPPDLKRQATPKYPDNTMC